MSITLENCNRRLEEFIELMDKAEASQTFEDIKPVILRLIGICTEMSSDIESEAIRNNDFHSLMRSLAMKYVIGLRKIKEEEDIS